MARGLFAYNVVLTRIRGNKLLQEYRGRTVYNDFNGNIIYGVGIVITFEYYRRYVSNWVLIYI